MVVRDLPSAETDAPEETEKAKVLPKPSRHLSVLAVQSIACVVVLLLVLLLRAAGGEAYDSLRRSFHDALARNELVTALAILWDGDPLKDEEIAANSPVKEDDFTGERDS